MCFMNDIGQSLLVAMVRTRDASSSRARTPGQDDSQDIVIDRLIELVEQQSQQIQ